ncbi:hypothetical protein GY14_25050 [Delftia tsuruhatensis]|nr:hypothetical protein GY14_25050 [Delftia tsuruhatensis]
MAPDRPSSAPTRAAASTRGTRHCSSSRLRRLSSPPSAASRSAGLAHWWPAQAAISRLASSSRTAPAQAPRRWM